MAKVLESDLIDAQPSIEPEPEVQQQQGEREQDERNRENEQHDGSQSEQQSAQWTGEEMSRDEHSEQRASAQPSEGLVSNIFDQRADGRGEGEADEDDPADEEEDEDDEDDEEEERDDHDGEEIQREIPSIEAAPLSSTSEYASRVIP